MGSLARAEALLLRRNPVALLNAFVGPLAVVGLLALTGDDPESGAGIVATLTALTLLSVVYYNLVTALVARREELVLKRLRSGQLGDAEILAGLRRRASPSRGCRLSSRWVPDFSFWGWVRR